MAKKKDPPAAQPMGADYVPPVPPAVGDDAIRRRAELQSIAQTRQEQQTLRGVPTNELGERYALPNINVNAGETARVFYEREFMKDDVPRLVHSNKLWYAYFNKLWRERSKSKVDSFINSRLMPYNMIQGRGDPTPFPREPRTIAKIRDMFAIESALINDNDAEPPFDWIGEQWVPRANGQGLLVCRGQVVDMLTLKASSNRTVFIPNGAEWEWEDEEREPVWWYRVLTDMFGSHEDSCPDVRLLRQVMGAALAGDNRDQRALLITGPRRAGKGTIGHVFNGIMGDSMVANPTLKSLAGRFGLASLVGRRLCLFSDETLSNRADMADVNGKLLKIIGGDKSAVDFKGIPESPTLAVNPFIVMLSNHRFMLHDSSDALFKRFMTIELRESFDGAKKIPNLYEDHLVPELPQIARWACGGYKDFRITCHGHFAETEASIRAGEAAFDSSNPHIAFFEECCEVKMGQHILNDDLVLLYRDYCHRNGMNLLATNALTRKLHEWDARLDTYNSHSKRGLLNAQLNAASLKALPALRDAAADDRKF